jgi:hypothetical protein
MGTLRGLSLRVHVPERQREDEQGRTHDDETGHRRYQSKNGSGPALAQDNDMHWIWLCVILFLPLVAPRPASAQAAPQSPPPYAPITSAERLDWIVDGTVGPKSLGVGVLSATWSTGWNTPEEWGRTGSGFAKRYAAREADVTLSNALEAGLGAIWGEEPRYIPAPRGPVGSRVMYAMKTVVLAQRRDGRLAPAWARYAGNTVNNLIENTWLPPSVTTGKQTALRSVNGFVGRLMGNLWEEFWPDIRRRLRR